jgi:tetratricopeptide (TPR) repeat protein
MAMELRLAVAEAHRNRGTYERARTVLLEAIKEGRTSLADDHPLMTRARIKLAYPAILGLDNISEELDKAIATARAMGSAGDELLVEGLIRRSRLDRVGQGKRGQEENREAYEIAQRSFGAGHPLTLEAAGYLSWFLPPPEALEVMTKAYRSALANPTMPAAHPMRLMTQVIYGRALARSGNAAEGLKLALEAVDTARHNHGAYGKATEETTVVLVTVYDTLLNQKGALDAAREAYRITTVREPPTSLNRRARANAFVMNSLGAGLIDGVGLAVDEILNVDYASEFEKRRPQFDAQRKLVKGLYLLYSGNTVEGERLLAESAREFESLKFSGVWARFFWAHAVLENGRPKEALQIVLEGPKPPVRSYSVATIVAHCHLALGDPRAALRAIEEADAANDPAARAPVKPELLYNAHGRALLELGRPREALEPLKNLLYYWTPFGDDNRYTAEARYWYGLALMRSGDAEGGRPLVQSALPVLKKSPMPSHRAIAARAQTS